MSNSPGPVALLSPHLDEFSIPREPSTMRLLLFPPMPVRDKNVSIESQLQQRTANIE